MHSIFVTARGSNPGPFDPKSDTLTTIPPPPVWTEAWVAKLFVGCGWKESFATGNYSPGSHGHTDYATQHCSTVPSFSDALRYRPLTVVAHPQYSCMSSVKYAFSCYIRTGIHFSCAGHVPPLILSRAKPITNKWTTGDGFSLRI